MVIRPYEDADQVGVIEIFREFMRDLTPEAHREAFERYIEAAIAEELSRIGHYYLARDGFGFWVAEDNGVIGTVGIEKASSTTAELRRMAVAKAHRRKGVARQLLQHSEGFCRAYGYTCLKLTTSALQPEATSLYESSGFGLVRTESDRTPSHKSVGIDLTYFFYEKYLL